MSDGLPLWLARLRDAVAHVEADLPSAVAGGSVAGRSVAGGAAGRPSAVLMLLGQDREGPDLLLIERAADLRSHAGQPAFPGGAVDEGDEGPVAAALREATEETGLDPRGVDVLGTLPSIFLPPSGYTVTPVLAWWRRPAAVGVVDVREVAAVHRVPIAELADPANRLRVRHPLGYVGPAFRVRGMVVWGFTGALVDRLLRLGGWEQPWDLTRVEVMPVGGRG